jgi:hypothetical protein
MMENEGEKEMRRSFDINRMNVCKCITEREGEREREG